MESQLVRSSTIIDSFILPPSSKDFWSSSLLLLFDFGWVLWSRLDLEVPIDSDRLQMRSLGWSDASFGFLRLSKRLFRASYDWNSWLHFPSLACGRPPSRPVSIFWCMERLFYFHLNRMERKDHRFFGGYFYTSLHTNWPPTCTYFLYFTLHKLDHALYTPLFYTVHGTAENWLTETPQCGQKAAGPKYFL